MSFHLGATTAALRIAIKGMHCASCVGGVEKAVGAVPSVASVSVNLATEQANVSFVGPADLEAVIAAINRVGYAAVLSTAQFSISKLDCEDCVNRVEEAFQSVEGVVEANVQSRDRGLAQCALSGEATDAGDDRQDGDRGGLSNAGNQTRQSRARPRSRGPDGHRSSDPRHDPGVCPDLACLCARDGLHVFPAVHCVRDGAHRDADKPDH